MRVAARCAKPNSVDQLHSTPGAENCLAQRQTLGIVKWAAIISVWSPFVAFILTLVLLAGVGDNLDKITFQKREAVVAGGALITGVGLLLACFALWSTRLVGRKGIFGRALFGAAGNGLLLCAAVCGIGALMRLNSAMEELHSRGDATN